MNGAPVAGRHGVRLLRPVLLGVVAGVIALSLFEWVVVQQRVRANTALASQLAAVRDENNQTEHVLADYESFKREAEKTERRFELAIDAVPTEAELAGALQDLESVTKAAGVSLVRFAPGVSRDTAPPAPSSPARKPAQAASPVVGPAINARPLAVTVRCGFADYQSLLGRLATYPRLLTVEGFRMKSANTGGYTIEASLALNCYFKQAPPVTIPAPSGSRR